MCQAHLFTPRAQPYFKVVSVTAFLIIMSTLPRMLIVLFEPFEKVELRSFDHGEFLETLVGEWNEAPITKLWIQDAPCDNPAF